MLLELLIGSIALGTLVYFLSSKRNASGFNMPGPKGWPLIGNLFDINQLKPHLSFEKWSKQYGDIFQVNFAADKWVIVTKYEDIHEALVTSGMSFAGRKEIFRLAYITSNYGIFVRNPTYPEWKSSRKFVIKHARQFGDGLSKLDDVLSQLLENLTKKIHSYDGAAIDMSDTIYDLTVSVVYAMLTGTVSLSDAERLEMFQSFANLILVTCSLANGLELDTFPWLRFFGHPMFAKLKQAKELRERLWQKMWIESHKTFVKGEPTCMLHAMRETLDQTSSNFIPEMDEECLKGILSDFVIGGISTTTSSAYALLNILLHYPDVKHRLHQEVDRVTESSSRRPTLADKGNMPYTMAVIYELLRYTTIAPIIGRKMMEETTLHGYRLLPQTSVIFNMWSVHHDEAFWGDPGSFRPERFLDPAGQLVPADHPNRKRLLPFGAGTRVCVGEVFALRRLFLFTAYMMQSFDPQPDEKTGLASCDPRDSDLGLVLSPTPYRIRMKPRHHITS